MIRLPAPRLDGELSLERALAQRRSVREFVDRPPTEEELSQLLWAAQGITNDAGDRTAPSAGALFPLEVYVATAAGVFLYEAARHCLHCVSASDARVAIRGAALDQEMIAQAPAVFLIAAVYERTEARYGAARSPRYVHMEAGHAAQNILLEAVALGLGGVVVGAFEDARLHTALALPDDHRPVYLVAVGPPRG